MIRNSTITMLIVASFIYGSQIFGHGYMVGTMVTLLILGAGWVWKQVEENREGKEGNPDKNSP